MTSSRSIAQRLPKASRAWTTPRACRFARNPSSQTGARDDHTIEPAISPRPRLYARRSSRHVDAAGDRSPRGDEGRFASYVGRVKSEAHDRGFVACRIEVERIAHAR